MTLQLHKKPARPNKTCRFRFGVVRASNPRGLEAEIALAFGDLDQALFTRGTELLVGDLRQFAFDHLFARFARLGRSVVAEVFLDRHDGVGLAVVGDVAALGELHEAVARTAGTVAGRAEAREVVVFEEPADDFVEAAAVARFELGRVFDVLDVADRVAAHGRARAPGNLRDADLERFGADAAAFARRHDHARVGNRKADEGDDLEEGVVGHGIREGRGIDVVRRADARNGNRVRTHAEDGFEVLGVHEEADEVVAVEVEPEEDAQTHVVDPRFHGAVVCFGVVGVVGLRSLRMEFRVGRFVVGFLEELIRADLRFVELLVVFDRRRGDVHVETADFAVLVLDRVDGLDRFEDVLDRVHLRVLARFEEKTLVTEVLQSDHFAADLVLGELLADDVLVLRVVRAVGAAVDAVVGEVEGSEENDAGTVDVVLHGLSRFEDAGVAVFEFAGEENGGFAVGETLEGGGLLKNRLDQGAIVLVLVGPGQRGLDLVVVDELLGLSGLGIVHGYGPQGNSNFRRSSRSNRLEKAVGGLRVAGRAHARAEGLGAIGARGKAPRA